MSIFKQPIGVMRLVAFSTIALALSACKIELHSKLSERDANEMMARLLANDIVATKAIDKDGAVTLMVDESEFSEAFELLDAYGLPRKTFTNMGEVFNTEGLVSSPMQEWARFNFALTQELSNTISSIPGVISADVHISNPKKESPLHEPPPPSASVLVLINREFITEKLIPEIKQLVSFSVQNVSYDRVGVVVNSIDAPQKKQLKMVNFGGIMMHPDSQMKAKIIAAVAGLIMLAVIGGSVFLLMMRNHHVKEDEAA